MSSLFAHLNAKLVLAHVMRSWPVICAAVLLIAAGRWQGASLGVAFGQSPSTPLDRAIALLNETRARWESVQDYRCTLLKQERINGVLLPLEVIEMKARTNSYSIFLKWWAPAAMQGQKVCYVADWPKMRVQPTGWLGTFGYFSIALRDARAMKQNRHTITEAGIGYLLDSTARYWQMESRLNGTLVQITDRVVHDRPCICIETTHADPTAGSFYAYRCILCLDRESRLPALVEAYDRPRPNGPPEGELLEHYEYVNLQVNVGLEDRVFRH